MVKNPPAMRETWVGSLDWEDALEKGMATHSSTLAWRTPWTEEHGVLQSTGLQRVGLDWVTKYSTYQFSSGVQSCLTLCNPMDYSTPGVPVHHQLPELAQTHVHRVGDAIKAISSSVVPFSSSLQSFPASGSFPVSRFFPSGGLSIGASASASVLPTNIQDWFPFRLTGLISLQSKD